MSDFYFRYISLPHKPENQIQVICDYIMGILDKCYKLKIM